MRRKHFGIIGLIVTCLSLGAVGLDSYHTFRKIERHGTISQPKVRQSVFDMDRFAVEEMQKLQKELPKLATPAVAIPAEVNFGLFGHRPGKVWDGTFDDQGTDLSHRMKYSISFAFAGKTKAFCVIDGVFYKQGGRFADGGEIAKIEARRVLIDKGGIKHWFPVKQVSEYKGKTKSGEKK